MLLLAREYFGKTKTTLRGNGIGVTHTSGVILFSLKGGVRIPTLLRLSPEGSIQYAFWNGEKA